MPAEDREIMQLSNGKPYLKLSNLHKELTESDIADLFSTNIGEIEFVKIPVYTNGESKGYGFVCFVDPANNEIAIEKFDGAPAMDLPLSISYGMPLESRIGINANTSKGRVSNRDNTLARDNKYRKGGNYRERNDGSEREKRHHDPEAAKARQQKALEDLDAELENYKNGANAQSNTNETGFANAADLDADLENYRNSSVPPLSEGTSS